MMKASSATAKQLVITAHTAEPEKLAKRAVELTKSKGREELSVVMALLAATGS